MVDLKPYTLKMDLVGGNPMTPAPIALFVYNRPWHTQQTVEALKRDELIL